MPDLWRPKRPTRVKAPPANALSGAEIVRPSQASATSEKGRAEQAFDRALAVEKAQAQQVSANAEAGADHSYADMVSDKFDATMSALQSFLSISEDLLQNHALVLSGPQELQMLGIPTSLASVETDMLGEVANVLGSALIKAALDGTRNIHAQYQEYLSSLPTIIHPMVSFSPDACWVIGIKDWRVAVVLPGDRDKVRDMPQEAKIASAEAMNWAKQIHSRPGIRRTKTQDEMLASLVSGNEDKASPTAVVVSPPWPPTNVKVHKEREFRSWWYRVARNRVMITWEPPVYNGGLGGTSIRVLTFPPPDDTAVPDPDAAAITAPPPITEDNESSEYHGNLNSVHITGLDATTLYRFAVVAVNALGYSGRTEATFTF